MEVKNEVKNTAQTDIGNEQGKYNSSTRVERGRSRPKGFQRHSLVEDQVRSNGPGGQK